ncbi:MAG: cob(I)yrinic acid a,c-diamide adenosyltransferase [Alistipes sp.]|jgi:ATP:cob(I)alamin adenosyltransferase|nr:cob(I)yrinic acid a,c-diamide adenosyltransferase [Alistipes sp.]
MATRIYTRGGDDGTTGTHGGGSRVAKDDPRIEAVGSLDEVNCLLGVVRSLLPASDERQVVLHRLQREMMVAMSLVCTPSARRGENPNVCDPEIVKWCEGEIDARMAACPDRDFFVLPGGTAVSAQLQLARAVTRRAERRLWTLHSIDPLPDEILRFVNRLSDLLFAMARGEMAGCGRGEELWQAFAYKNRRKP